MPIILVMPPPQAPPPEAPPVAQTEHEPPRARIDFRVQQIFLSIVTVGITCWLWTIHPIVGIAAIFIAKHILVAILASGLSYPPVREEKR
jgi:hypothetical protein